MSKMFDYISGKSEGREAELEASLEHALGHLGIEIEENTKLREALSWLEDHEPQLVDAAKEKFGIK